MEARFQQQSQKSVKEMDLKVDSEANPVAVKEGSPSEATSCISSAGDAMGSVKGNELDHESLSTYEGLPYASSNYYGYYFPGYEGGSYGEVDDQGYYLAGDGMELQYPVMQAENGSLVYMMPGFQQSYSPYLPVNGNGGGYLGQQPYSPNTLYASPGYHTNPFTYGEILPAPYMCDPSAFVMDGTYGSYYAGVPEIPPSNSPGTSYTPLPKNFQHSELRNPSVHSSDVLSDHSVHTQMKPQNKASQRGSSFQSNALSPGSFPFTNMPMYNQGKNGVAYSSSHVGLKTNNGRGWGTSEKPKPRSKIINNSVSDDNFVSSNGKSSLTPGVNEENQYHGMISSLNTKDQYNLAEFATQYDEGFFFVIKSYSEDDIHKSIKYNVWASTPNGNKRLDSAYQEAQERMADKGINCPVFLFFSVNASGQFCGVAEMMGRVNFDKSMDFWQQDKWNGYFPVKWHIIKDVPNPQLRHIILENNDNKPVTNSRDTQEVRFPQGIEMLKLFKNYVTKTSILDDFNFYENREKVMLEKKIRPCFDQIKKVEELSIGIQSVDLTDATNIEESFSGGKAKD